VCDLAGWCLAARENEGILKQMQEDKMRVVEIADVLNDINRAIGKYGLEVMAYDITDVFTEISLDWKLGVKSKFDVEEDKG